jgi:DNA-binding GntR family transcriptional regulator
MPIDAVRKAPLIKRKSLADSVHQYLVEAILTGKLPGGTELSEVALAAELGVSRTPVHEAIRRMVPDRLIEVLPNRTVRVVWFGVEDLVEVYEMRKLLEPASAERAARRLSVEELAELRAAANALEKSSGKKGWIEQAFDFDDWFHTRLAAACCNGRLQAEIAKYRRLACVFCRMIDDFPRLLQAFREHLLILEAMERRDPFQARRAMEDHIESRMQAVLQEVKSRRE